MLDWNEVIDSSRVVAVAYDGDQEAIFVRFPNGVEWRYDACPSHVWEEFIAPNTSKGSFIHHTLNRLPNARHEG
jgi:hypothetical protein